MRTARSGHRACVSNGQLFVIGGFSTNSIEFYDPRSSTWFLELQALSIPRDRSVVVNIDANRYFDVSSAI